MKRLFEDYEKNLALISKKLRVDENFDLIERRLTLKGGEAAFFYVDSFVKEGDMLRIMQFLLSEKGPFGAEELSKKIPYVEVSLTSDADAAAVAVLSGQTLMLFEHFGEVAVLIDARTYPSRPTAEPNSDRVMQGAHDGFVETLVTNTALIRRRIRDERLTMRHFNLGGASQTDVVLCYMDGIADVKVVDEVAKKLGAAKPRSLTLGFQSLAEVLIGRGWLNPFPKIRTTERPDTAAAQLMEGSVLVLCDTSPQVMLLPTSIFHYLEQTDDYYFPPLTGTYLSLIRTAILLLSTVITPLWYLALKYAERLPESLLFLIPDEPGALPIILQLFLVEFAIDGLKIASMNTPDMLSNSLSIVGALILGDFAVTVGWLSADVILYMAFVAIASFAQQNHELGYAIKFSRLVILGLVYLFGIWGFVVGIMLFIFTVATNNTVTKKGYLSPFFPPKARGIARILFRKRKEK